MNIDNLKKILNEIESNPDFKLFESFYEILKDEKDLTKKIIERKRKIDIILNVNKRSKSN